MDAVNKRNSRKSTRMNRLAVLVSGFIFAAYIFHNLLVLMFWKLILILFLFKNTQSYDLFHSINLAFSVNSDIPKYVMDPCLHLARNLSPTFSLLGLPCDMR